jgi:hypothetical protein
MQKITILIPTLANKKSLPYLKKCIQSIRDGQSIAHDIKVMINGGVMSDPKELPAAFYITLGQGQCQAVNKLAKMVETEWMLVTDDDSIFPPNWERLFEDETASKSDVICMNSMESGKVGSAPPFVVNDCGQDIEHFDYEKFKIDAVNIGSEEGGKPGHLEKGFSYPFAIKTELWHKIEGYDENYDPWGSNCDSDLHYKIRIAGVQPLRDRRILNYHFSQISGTFDFSDTPEGNEHNRRWNMNKRYFTEKWGFERANSPEIWYYFDIPNQRKYHPAWEKKE